MKKYSTEWTDIMLKLVAVGNTHTTFALSIYRKPSYNMTLTCFKHYTVLYMLKFRKLLSQINKHQFCVQRCGVGCWVDDFQEEVNW